MRWTTALTYLFASALMAAEPADPMTLDVPAEKLAKAKVLVGQLADEDVGVRVKAAEGLTQMGREALPALVEARNGKPADNLRDRLDRMIVDARKADFDARAAVFLADKDRKFDHAILGWNELKAAAKDTKESRLLFADMLNDEQCRDMLLLAFDPTDEGRARFEKRWEAKMDEWQAGERADRRAGNRNSLWPKADTPIQWMPAALIADLLYGSDYRSYHRQPAINAYAFHTDEMKLAIEGKGKYGPTVSAVVSYWISQQKGRFGLQDVWSIAKTMKFDKAVQQKSQEALFDLIVSTGESNPVLGQLSASRDSKYIARFRLLFAQEKPFWSPRPESPRPEIQLQDAALSMCIALSGQDPTEYGFTSENNAKKVTDPQRYSPYNYYFEKDDKQTADDKRKAAFKKWAEWEKANPDAIKAKPPEKKEK